MTGSDRDIAQRRVSEDEIDRAISWLRDSAKVLGEARQRMVSAGHMIKHIEALEFKMSGASSAEARKADARASQRFVEAITEEAVATGEYEKLRALREAAALKIEIFRTESANFRSMRIG